jgi:hypothetical protein
MMTGTDTTAVSKTAVIPSGKAKIISAKAVRNVKIAIILSIY